MLAIMMSINDTTRPYPLLGDPGLVQGMTFTPVKQFHWASIAVNPIVRWKGVAIAKMDKMSYGENYESHLS